MGPSRPAGPAPAKKQNDEPSPPKKKKGKSSQNNKITYGVQKGTLGNLMGESLGVSHKAASSGPVKEDTKADAASIAYHTKVDPKTTKRLSNIVMQNIGASGSLKPSTLAAAQKAKKRPKKKS